ncbi:MgtC/SapB family protein [Humisphaera borealis]|uniref:MgtC/SapB family protein n=1 Tax=Humisphaera borealis TaxID=2807512 RepID=A0A7M2X4A0_9BACT|nr:DUF4010 domain-containing protein [Humisphaera borealis]QOV91871.1 MgtC/SapB family protein [Humisphaera borealis]
MELSTALTKLGIALGLGLLVGLERERAASATAGIRTFALIALAGAVCGLTSPVAGGWVIAAGAIGVAALLAVGHWTEARFSDKELGLTTEVAGLAVFAIAAYIAVGYTALGVVAGGATALLLHWKEPLHAFVKRIGPTDITAIMRFVLIALVVLPVLPDRTYGPLAVLNPKQIWLVVVLIVAISLGGYVAFKMFGGRAGTLLGGLLGGLISSTATTVSYARRSRDADRNAPGAGSLIGLATLVIIIASAVSMFRVVGEVVVVAPKVAPAIAPPLATLALVMLGIAGIFFWRHRADPVDLPEPNNPAELKAALLFALLYAAVLLAVAAAKNYFGDQALYGVAVFSGLTDMDAITLSTAGLVNEGRIATETGWRVILIAAMSNLAFKAGAVLFLGSRVLAWRVGLLFGISSAVGIAILLLWPAWLSQWFMKLAGA